MRPSSTSGSKPSAPRRGAAPAPERLLPPIPVRRRRPLDGGGRLDDNWSPNQEKSMSPKVGVAPLRREQIVRATIRCLARDGYAGLTMKKVARTAGVSQGILHYYFADKRAILVAALEMVMADLDRRVAQGIEVGTFRRVDVVQAAAVVLALVDGVSLQLTFDPRAFGAAAAVRLCEDVLTRYLEKEAP